MDINIWDRIEKTEDDLQAKEQDAPKTSYKHIPLIQMFELIENIPRAMKMGKNLNFKESK